MEQTLPFPPRTTTKPLPFPSRTTTKPHPFPYRTTTKEYKLFSFNRGVDLKKREGGAVCFWVPFHPDKGQFGVKFPFKSQIWKIRKLA